MKLVPCKVCGEMISDQATTCPKCGAPVEQVEKPVVDASKVDMFLNVHKKELPEAQLPMIREKLLTLDADKFAAINMLQFKNPTTVLIVSIFLGLFGVDRFMIGDTGLGVAKLLTGGGCGYWAIVDWFIIAGKTRQRNLKKLQAYL